MKERCIPSPLSRSVNSSPPSPDERLREGLLVELGPTLVTSEYFSKSLICTALWLATSLVHFVIFNVLCSCTLSKIVPLPAASPTDDLAKPAKEGLPEMRSDVTPLDKWIPVVYQEEDPPHTKNVWTEQRHHFMVTSLT